MNLLIASILDDIKEAILAQLAVEGINGDQITVVNTVSKFIKAIKTDAYNLIICEYSITGADIWQIAKLLSSSPISDHMLPLFLVEETCDLEIPPLLAREHAFFIVSINKLGAAVTSVNENNRNISNEHRGLTSTKHHLLIIEDDEDAVYSAYHALKDSYDIDTAKDGLSGFDLWENKRHDLVLLDLMLPVMKGDEVLNKMMAIDEHQPVIIVTGHDRAFNSQDLLLNGASEYLCKPFSMSTLKMQCQAILVRAKLIYQAHYANKKLESLRSLIWALDQAQSQKNADKAQRIMTAITTLLPGKPTEDELASLADMGF
ncbi:MAG: response regulator [Methylococcaceae bacterium]|nr:response regulator [Methylococcaceae bacterium]